MLLIFYLEFLKEILPSFFLFIFVCVWHEQLVLFSVSFIYLLYLYESHADISLSLQSGQRIFVDLN